MAKPPIITLLTDFGLTDHYVAAMKGVVLGICPGAQLVDISHEIRAFGIEEAAFTLGQAYPCFPGGTIHLVVVDPGVGSERRPLLLEAAGQSFVGPDNGVFSIAMDRDPRHKVREIRAPRYYRQPVSNTFHGRDIFAPVAAWLATGVAPAKMSARISNPVRLDFDGAGQVGEGHWIGRILFVDRFGNLVTNFRTADVPQLGTRPFEMQIQKVSISQYYPLYAEAPTGVAVAIAGSSGYIEVSVNKGDASKLTKASMNAPVLLRFL